MSLSFTPRRRSPSFRGIVDDVLTVYLCSCVFSEGLALPEGVSCASWTAGGCDDQRAATESELAHGVPLDGPDSFGRRLGVAATLVVCEWCGPSRCLEDDGAVHTTLRSTMVSTEPTLPAPMWTGHTTSSDNPRHPRAHLADVLGNG